jgi:hypothetical protein
LKIKRLILGALGSAVVLAALVYLADYAIWRYREARGKNPYGSVTIQVYYAIGEKSGKTEYDFEPPQQETCVNSWFPHAGYPPCWYERKHTEKEIKI